MPECGQLSHIVKMHYIFKNLLLYFGGCFRQTQKNSFDNVHIDSYCINRLYCSFPLALLIFMPPLKKGDIVLQLSVGRYVGRSVGWSVGR